MILAGLGAPIASAQEGDDDGGEAAARLHFEAGRSHYDNGAYEAALQEFEVAYELSGRAELLYNLYLTVERTGDLDRALDYLQRYLAEGSPDAGRRRQLEMRLENLQERRARLGSDAPPAETPGGGGGGGGDIVPAAIAFGVAGAGLVSFAIFGGLALAEDDALASGCGATRSCTDAQVSDLMAFDIAADVSWVTAAVAATAGVVLLVTLGLDSSGGEEATASVVPWAAPGAAGLSSTVRF